MEGKINQTLDDRPPVLKAEDPPMSARDTLAVVKRQSI